MTEEESETSETPEIEDTVEAANDERTEQDSKFQDFKAPEENRHKWKPKEWQNSAFQGVSAFDFAMQQKRKEKERKEKEAEARVQMYRYQGKPNEDAEAQNRKEQFDREKQWKVSERASTSIQTMWILILLTVYINVV